MAAAGVAPPAGAMHWINQNSSNKAYRSSMDDTSRDSAHRLSQREIRQLNREMRMSVQGPDSQDRNSKAYEASPFPAGGPCDEAGSQDSGPKTAMQRNLDGMKSILIHPFSLLLVAFPLGIYSSMAGWDANLTFWLNFAALIPLAKILGDATEELDACLKSEVISGLLNATFGNAVEMIMTVQTLRAGLLDVVKATLLGSVLSNLLLVLGMSFFFGGILELGHPPPKDEDAEGSPNTLLDVSYTESMQGREPLLQGQRAPDSAGAAGGRGMRLVAEKEQTFTVNSALVSVTMLLVSCLSFALPTVFAQGFGDQDTVVSISRTSAWIIGVSYFAYLFFQLFSHRQLLANDDDGDDDEEEEGLTVYCSLGLLAFTTLLVSFSSELLVDCIESVVEKSHISECFIGTILLPIVGNACEHAAAVRFAVQNKPGLSISIAVGSSVQVALFVVPFAVLMGQAIGQPMTLDFGLLNTTVLVLCVLVVLTIVVDGRSNWLEGYMLCSAYALIAVMYWHVNSFSDFQPGGMAEL